MTKLKAVETAQDNSDLKSLDLKSFYATISYSEGIKDKNSENITW